jgi:uncharacterized protein YkwD
MSQQQFDPELDNPPNYHPNQDPSMDPNQLNQNPEELAEMNNKGQHEVKLSDDGFTTEIEDEIVSAVNAERKKVGLPPLKKNPLLTKAARSHSKEMTELNYFAHESPNPQNRDFTDRMKQAGVTFWGFAGENIAMINTTKDATRQFMKMWMYSEGHRENILSKEYEYIGVGVHGNGQKLNATQVFSKKVTSEK